MPTPMNMDLGAASRKNYLEGGEFLKVPEVAQRCRCANQTVYGWFSKGLLRRTRISGMVVVRRDDLEDFLWRCNATEPSKRKRGRPRKAAPIEADGKRKGKVDS